MDHVVCPAAVYSFLHLDFWMFSGRLCHLHGVVESAGVGREGVTHQLILARSTTVGSSSQHRQWQTFSSSTIWPRLSPTEQALFSSQSGPMSGLPFTSECRRASLSGSGSTCPTTRRLEVVANGLLLFGGAQLAVDTTLVSPVQVNGHPRRHCAEEDGAALQQARQRKPLTYPNLSGAFGRAQLVVLAAKWEVVGRMKPTLSFASWQRRRRVLSPAS